MHLLDLGLYFVIGFILWQLIRIISGGQWTQEIGALAGVGIMIVYTIIYIIIFWICGINWVDIDFSGLRTFFKL